MTNLIVRCSKSPTHLPTLKNLLSKSVDKIWKGVTHKSNEVTDKSSDVEDGVHCSNTGKTVGCQGELQSSEPIGFNVEGT